MNRFSLAIFFACAFLINGCAAGPGLNEFASDGCSLFPDGTIDDRSQWCDCCYKHDIAYWRGGSEVERDAADDALSACVMERTGNKILAGAMYNGVRAGGNPIFPTWCRWGYGWKYGREYKPLTKEENKQVAGMLDRYNKKIRQDIAASNEDSRSKRAGHSIRLQPVQGHFSAVHVAPHVLPDPERGRVSRTKCNQPLDKMDIHLHERQKFRSSM